MKDIELARRVLRSEVIGDQVGLLTTVSKMGVPHATWMATYAFVDQNQIITLTSPDSLKAKNVSLNSDVEWLFTSSNFQFLIYFVGQAFLEEDPVFFKKYWNQLPDKHRAYFLESYNSPPGFLTIRTEIERAYFKVPKESKTVELDIVELLADDGNAVGS